MLPELQAITRWRQYSRPRLSRFHFALRAFDASAVDCLTITPNAEEPQLRDRFAAPASNVEQPLFVSGPLKQTRRVMIKDENICLHCGLCAERCPTYAWDMRKFTLHVPYAGATVIPLIAV